MGQSTIIKVWLPQIWFNLEWFVNRFFWPSNKKKLVPECVQVIDILIWNIVTGLFAHEKKELDKPNFQIMGELSGYNKIYLQI